MSSPPPLVLAHFEPLVHLGESLGAELWSVEDRRFGQRLLGVRLVGQRLATQALVAPLIDFLEPNTSVLAPLAHGPAEASPETWLVYDCDPERLLTTLELDPALHVLKAVAVALEPLHAQGVAHGALERSLCGVHDGRVLLAGLGLAALRRLGLHSNDVRLAPELRGAQPPPATPSADTYALAVMAQELLPEPPESARGLLAQAMSEEPAARPSDLVSWVDALANCYTRQPAAAEAAATVEAPVAAEALASEALALEDAPQADMSAPVSVPVAGGAADAPASEPSEVPPPPESLPPSRKSGAGWIATLSLLLGAGLMLAVLGLAGYTMFQLRSSAGPVASTAPAPASSASTGRAALKPHPHGAVSAEPAQAIELPSVAGTAGAKDAAALLPVTLASPIWGDSKALVTVVMFGDLNCPFTRYTFRSLARIQNSMSDKLRLVFRHRPLSNRSRALANFAARLHTEHGAPKFWQFLDLISRERHPRDTDYARFVAKDLGLERAQVERLIQLASKLSKQQALDEAWALRYGVRKTPTVFINGERLEGLATEEQLRELIERERRAQVSALAMGVAPDRLYERRVQKVLIGLGETAPERQCVPLQGAPARAQGEQPSVTIVQFSDFECAYCADLSRNLERVSRGFPGQLRLVHRNFPLEKHPEARAAANLALHGMQSGNVETFWRLHDALLGEHRQLGTAAYRRVLEGLKLDVDGYLDAVARGAYDSNIDADLRIGEQLGVSGVPTLFINGRKLEGAQDVATLRALLRAEVHAMGRLSAAGFQPADVLHALCEGESL